MAFFAPIVAGVGAGGAAAGAVGSAAGLFAGGITAGTIAAGAGAAGLVASSIGTKAAVGIGTSLLTNKLGAVKQDKSFALENMRTQKLRAERGLRRKKLAGTLGGSLLTGGGGVRGQAPTQRKTLLGE